MLNKARRMNFLMETWEDLAAEAYGGFVSGGRGCLVIAIGPAYPTGPGTAGAEIKTGYVPAAGLAEIAHGIPDLDQFIAGYDPLTEIAIIWMDTEGNYELVQVGVLDFVKSKFENLRDLFERRKLFFKSTMTATPPFQSVRMGGGAGTDVSLN